MTTKRDTIRQYKLSLKRQSGISLIEIMIALVISLILLAGLSQIFISNKQAYRLQESVSYVNNNARFAMFFLQDVVAAAGYKGDPSESDNDAFPAGAVAGCGTFAKGQYINGGAAATDLFCVRMKSPNYSAGVNDLAVMTDCAGTNIAAGVIVTSRFFISANNELSCATVHSDGTTANQPLVDNVTINNLATDLVFGLDTDNDKMVDTTKDATTIATSDWPDVISVNISLNFNSDADSTGQRVTTDGEQLERTVTRSIAFRSRTNPLP